MNAINPKWLKDSGRARGTHQSVPARTLKSGTYVTVHKRSQAVTMTVGRKPEGEYSARDLMLPGGIRRERVY
jgi:hypothetical protein